jgi:peptidoglycan lytic transglycosylase
MRTIMSIAIAMIGFSTALTTTAEARTHWKCVGAAYVCGSPAKKVSYTKKSYGKKTYKKYKKSTKKYGYKSKKTYSKKRKYSGGGGSGIASYYWQPQRVASGGWFNPNALTAAHKTLPFGTRVRVTNMRNGKSVTVRINDRGPYIKGRVIDLSKRAAGVIGMRGAGLAPVKLTVLGRG